jgi:hypothetical protein
MGLGKEDREAFKAVLDPLVFALGAGFDLPTWTIYYRALGDVPRHLLAAAVERAAKSATFMPKPAELRQYAEEARKALIASKQFVCVCGDCSQQGFVEVEVNGVKRMERGACWRRHQAEIAALGVGTEPLSLPPARGDWNDPEAAL